MPRTKISEFSSTPASNTDIDSINLAEGCAPSGINDAIRELMAQLKDWQSGTSNDPYVVGSSGSLTLNQGTANGVAYLNGSKVVTSGSALVFDGTNLGVGTSSPSGASGKAIEVYGGSGQARFVLKNDATGSASSDGSQIALVGSQLVIQNRENSEITFETNGSERMRLDTSGNLGLGVTPSAWGSSYKMFQASTGASFGGTGNIAIVGSNYYNDGSSKYIGTGLAALYLQDSGLHKWFNAASGTAGNAITFTQAMTLDASGKLAIGTTTSNGYLTLKNTNPSTSLISIQSYASTTEIASIKFDQGTDLLSINTVNVAAGITFGTNGTERARIDSSGKFLLGTTAGGGELSFKDATGVKIQFNADAANSYTISKLAGGGGLGDGEFKFTSGNTSAGAFTFSSGGSERVRIDSSGNLLVGTTSAYASAKMSLGFVGSANNGLVINNTNSSGSPVHMAFQLSGTSVGSITCSGSSTAYNTSSDYRLKNVTGALTGYKERLMSLQPKQGTWIADGSEFRGFLAHEFAEPYRASVTGEKDAVDETGNPIYQGMQASSSEVMADLVAMVNELITENASLKARLDAANL